jgi:hypothetical protein
VVVDEPPVDFEAGLSFFAGVVDSAGVLSGILGALDAGAFAVERESVR